MDYFTDPGVYETAYKEALKKNSQVTAQIQNFKKELEDVRLNLEQNQKHLFQNIMVPIGSKALMKGKLVHTNEVHVNLGDRWFVKTSASRAIEICDRMISRCDQNLGEFEKESKLLNSNLEIPQEFEVFPSGDVKDIIEPYDEETEKLWREKHRQRVKELKIQEAAIRISDAELFEKLERLEEEENEELAETDDKMGQYKSLSHITESEASVEENPSSECVDDLILNDALPLEKNSKKRVSFSDADMTQDQPSSTATVDEPFIIRFKHSENKPKPENFAKSDEILSPTDIHRKFLQQFSPKSILKNKNQGQTCGNISTGLSNSTVSDLVEVEEEMSEVREYNTVNVLGDVIEKMPFTPVETEKETRPLSKFKKSRAQNH